jgi:hypothetical protein
MGPVEVSQAAKQIWRFGSQLSRGVCGSPAIFDVIPTTLPHLMTALELLRFRIIPTTLPRGDGHPGGQIIMFQPGNIQIDYSNAIRNPYCYQYYADWVSP